MKNLLLIFSDQHAKSIAGCYGDDVVRTPNLDRLAAQGVVFDNAYTNSPLCVPARAAFLTGRHPHSIGVWTNADALPSSVPTHAHSLGAAGMNVHLSGRLHTIGPDQLHGYASRDVGDSSTNWIGGQAHSLGRLERTNEPFRVSLERSGAGGSSYLTKDRVVTDAALRWLKDAAKPDAQGRSKPFALTVGYILPHQPYVSSPETFDYYYRRIAAPQRPISSREHPHIAAWRRHTGITDVPDDWVRRARAAYYGMVEEMDAMIGELLNALDRTGLAQETLVVYVSDHGDHCGERGLWWKQTFFDESVKVPLILSAPGVLPAGERRDHVVSLIDLTATMIEAVGAPELPGIDGISFWKVAQDATVPWINEVFAEYCIETRERWVMDDPVRQRMVRHDNYKYVYHHGHPSQLFDLAADPLELNDLADDPCHAAIARRLRARVLSGWDPDRIAQLQRRRLDDTALLGRWAHNVDPAESFRWISRMDDNWLREHEPVAEISRSEHQQDA